MKIVPESIQENAMLSASLFPLFESHALRTIERLKRAGPLPLRLQLWNGRRIDFSAEPTVTVSIPKPSGLRYFISPDLNKLGEAFVEGHIRVEGKAREIFRVACALAQATGRTARSGYHRLARHGREHDRRAVQYHYDVSNAFYALFLDEGMVYSCAYYRTDEDSLEKAQIQKLDHILAKLALKPGERFLDIGCGWGALMLRAAKCHGAVVTGVTLSRNQHEYVGELIRKEGLQDRCTVELRDYRDLQGGYDKIASVGMFEHVGLKNLPEYFGKIHSLLSDGGLVLNHGITTSNVDSTWMGLGAGEFIDKYVFPDGELPHLSLVVEKLASAGFEVVDVESLRRHYTRTCQEWSDRLEGNHDKAVDAAGERQVRIWQIYLAGCAFGFAQGWMNLYQILAAKKQAMPSLPMTRDYMYGSGRG
jgi:cyclopropane-fatty-acyl-phospholipid synthase